MKVSRYSNTHPISNKQHSNPSYLFFCLTLLHNTEVRGFKILFQKPVNGQQTNSNASTVRRQTHALYSYKFEKLAKIVSINLTKPIFIAEYVNLFWQHQWVYEWVSGYKNLQKLPIYVRRTNFIDIPNMNRYNIYNFYQNPFKRVNKQSHRRKKVIPKNKYATGYPFGFSFIYSKQLQTIN